MIKDMGNVELFELFDTECLPCWNQGIVYCTCVHILRERINPAEVSSDGHWIFCQSRTTSLRKGLPHGHRYGKTEEPRDHHIAHNLRERCIKKHYEGIHHRFVNDPDFRASQLEHDRDEEVCIKMEELAQE